MVVLLLEKGTFQHVLFQLNCFGVKGRSMVVEAYFYSLQAKKSGRLLVDDFDWRKEILEGLFLVG